jgi:aryl-alcohol dehydrogenase-like predicted oxidoreductase
MTSLPTVTLGDGLEVSALGFGSMALSDVYGTTDHDEAVRTLHAALDAGVTFLDTADVYGTPREGTTGPSGTNEELLARVLADRRDEVQLATKFGITGVVGQGAGVRGDRDYVRAACEASLRRLGVDTIDLYYMHRRQLDLPITETVAAMAELVAEGKVRHLGLSEVTATELADAAAVHPIAAVQSEWSIWSRDVEAAVVPRAVELGVGFVPYSPLGRGFLTGTVTAERVSQTLLSKQPRFAEHFDANQKVVDVVREVAGELGAAPAQVALAWVYAQGAAFGVPTVPIPGTRSAQRVVENAGAVGLALSADRKARLDAAADLVQGGRNFSFSADDWISSGRE